MAARYVSVSWETHMVPVRLTYPHHIRHQVYAYEAASVARGLPTWDTAISLGVGHMIQLSKKDFPGMLVKLSGGMFS